MDIPRIDGTCCTLLHCAVRAGNYNLVKTLIADGAPVDAKGTFLGYTPLHTAVRAREAKMVQLLVAGGADKEAKDGWGQTPLMAAASGGTSSAVAEALLAAGADPSLQGRGGETPFRMAAKMGHVPVLAILTTHEGVDVNDAGGLGGGTALHEAVTTKKADVVIDILVAAGANTEARNKRGNTPLHLACSRLDVQTAVALLRHGADINARGGNMCGDTPLHEAARQAGERGAVEMVDLLLRWGADETVTNSFGHTPADESGNRYSNVTEVGGVERVRKLLANAPVAREAWRRRGLLVASRAQPQMVFLSASTQQASGEWMDLMGRVLGLAEEGVFRTIVGYL